MGYVEELRKLVGNRKLIMPGVRAIIRDEAGGVLLQLRGDFKIWGYPAGSVELDESVQDALRREVFEEAGIKVGHVSYHSSQPWPFPSSIMIGFHAEGLTEEISIDTEELRDARWFTRDEIRNHRDLGFHLPRADSIARRLIEDWMAA